MTTSGFGKLFVGGMAIFLVAAASAQVSKQGNGYLFRMKFTKGQKINYVMVTDGTTQGQKFHVNMPMTQTVTAVSNGVGTVSMSIGAMSMTVNGKPMDRPMPKNMQNMTAKIDSQGRVAGGGAQQTTVVLPDKPIPIGGSWSGTTTTPAMGQSMQVSATYKFTGIERMGGFNAAKIAITMKGAGQMNIAGTGTLWLNMADGSMIKNATSMKMTMGQMVIPMTMSITRK